MKTFVDAITILSFFAFGFFLLLGFANPYFFILSAFFLVEFLHWNFKCRLLQDHEDIKNQLNAILTHFNIELPEPEEEASENEGKEEKDC